MEDLKLEDEESPPPIFGVGPLLGLLADREMGLLGQGRGRSRPRKVVGKLESWKLQPESEEIAEERLITKDPLGVLPCKLMGNHTRSTFLMVFSPDKELLASTHGDHNIYITEIKTGECIQTLKGHPRTPWCVAFHPSHKDLLASGCLGGHVRIWDLNGGSELWTTDSVIASLAFHPVERLLVIATLNELHFWDWSQDSKDSKNPGPSAPFCKVSTKSDKEKVRYVKFDSFGHHLITGIANLNNAMHNYSNIYSTTRGHMSAQHRVLARSRGRYGLQVPPSMNQMMPSTSDSSPTYGRYYRGTVDPIVRPRPQPPTSTNNLPTSTASSASQTLSDLAAAASDRLMAENAAAAAAAEAIRAQVAADLRTRSEDIREAAAAAAAAAQAAAEAAEVLPRFRRLPDDPLLSDHPYGMSNGGRPPPPNYGEILLRSADSRALSESIYHRERRIQQLLMRFRHSPESSFVEYAPEVSHHGDHHLGHGGHHGHGHHGTEMYVNPDRALASETNNRYREIRERRIQRQLERRQLRRNLQEYHRISASATSGSGSTRPIDDWAINRRLTLQQNQSGAGLSLGDPLLLTSSPTRAASLASNDDNDASSVIAQAGDIFEERRGGPNLRGPVEPEVVSRPTSTLVVGGSTLEGLRFPHGNGSPGSDIDHHQNNSVSANLAAAAAAASSSREPPPLPNPRDFLTSSPGSIAVTEFKCPFCERTYGFECNWRAHIREQHQGWTSRGESIRSQIAGSTTSTISNPASPGGSASGAPNNDHNYTLSPGTSSTASSAASTPVNNANRSSRDSNTNLNNIDIAQLNNHIDHMQRICRDSLADCTASRRRRQMIRLKSIKRILEDLQKQIRSLRNASKEETQNRNIIPSNTTPTTPSSSATSPAAGSSTSAGTSTSGLNNPTAGPSTSAAGVSASTSAETGNGSASTSAGTGNRPAPSSAEIQQMEDSEEDDIEASLGLDERNYDERVGEGNRMRSLAQRSLSMAIKRLSSEQPRRPPQPQESLHRTSNRLSRVHSQLVSQMRATFRAMEKSQQQQQQQPQPMLPNLLSEQLTGSSSATGSKSESASKKQQPPKSRENDPTKLGLNTKQELRALSQRLERMLREQREASDVVDLTENEQTTSTSGGTGNAAAKNNTTTTLAEMDDIDIPRPDPMPLDPRKRWRHMYDGTLPPRPSTSSTSTSTSNNSQSATLQELLDSSESGSESDFDIRNTGRWRTSSRVLRDLTTPRRLRWRPLDQRRMASSPHRHAQRVFVRRANGSGTMVDPVDVPYIEADEANEDMGTERLPPLRELIWRRLRRRNAHVRFEEEPEIINGLQRPPQATSRTREALSWMVDQMRIDQAANANPVDSTQQPETERQQQQPPPHPPPREPQERSTRTITSARSLPPGERPPASGNGVAPPWLSIGDLYGSDHASFRSRYVNRIRTEDAPNRMHRHNDHYMFSNQSQLLTHRIQAWDFSKGDIPDLTDSEANIVVQEAKIHNDASVDISEDGSLLVTLVPSNLPMTTVVGVYSLSPASKGRLFASFSLESSAVSVSLSPTSKHLMVGLAMRPPRITLSPSDRTLIAQIYRIKMPWENQVNNSSSGGNGNEEQQPPRGRLIHRRDLHQNEPGQTSLNCIRWIPVAGQGLVYATNTGLLKILR